MDPEFAEAAGLVRVFQPACTNPLLPLLGGEDPDDAGDAPTLRAAPSSKVHPTGELDAAVTEARPRIYFVEGGDDGSHGEHQEQRLVVAGA